MKQTYRVLAALIAIGVLVQAAAIAFGWFDALSEVEDGLVIDDNYEGNAGHVLHGMLGMMGMPLLGLVLLVVSFFAGKVVPGAVTWAAILFGLILLQVALAFVAFGAPIVGALHGINALAILGVAGRAAALAAPATAGRRQSGAPVDVPSQASGSSSPQQTRSV